MINLVSEIPLVNESTPEERLRRYKEQLQKMAESENRDLKFSNIVRINDDKQQGTSTREIEAEAVKTKSLKTSESPSPPQTLVSPSKRELRESMVVSSKSTRDAVAKRIADKDSKNKILMKARIKAIDSKLQDIKSRRSMIQLQYKRGLIDQSEYEKRMEILVAEGRELIKEKTVLDKSLSR